MVALAAPLSVTVAPFPLVVGLMVPEMLQVCDCEMVTVPPLPSWSWRYRRSRKPRSC